MKKLFLVCSLFAAMTFSVSAASTANIIDEKPKACCKKGEKKDKNCDDKKDDACCKNGGKKGKGACCKKTDEKKETPSNEKPAQ